MKISPIITLGAFLSDLIWINLSYVLAFYFSFGSFEYLDHFPWLNFWIYFNVIWFLLLRTVRPYRITRTTRVSAAVSSIYAVVTLHLLLISALFLFQRRPILSVEQLVYVYLMLYVGFLIWKVVFLYFMRFLREKGYGVAKVFTLGGGQQTERLIHFFSEHPEYGYRHLGHFDQADFHSLKERIAKAGIKQLFVNSHSISDQEIATLMDWAEDGTVQLCVISQLPFTLGKAEVEMFEDIPYWVASPIQLDYFSNRALKRGFDLLFSFFVVVGLLSWLTPILALAIILDSHGPVFFRQKRNGLNGKDFWVYKFRTMYVNDEADSKQKELNDKRVTNLGKFLRRTSIDELPQFFNVLLGEMSIVGPRPHMLEHTEHYRSLIDKYMARHRILPGITGLAQVRGYRGETQELSQMAARVRMDRFYLENWSLLLDIKIIIDTIRFGWRQKEAS
jgi:putative colanic acid biosysnthesis UDP-glucose lipid carrier transferase